PPRPARARAPSPPAAPRTRSSTPSSRTARGSSSSPRSDPGGGTGHPTGVVVGTVPPSPPPIGGRANGIHRGSSPRRPRSDSGRTGARIEGGTALVDPFDPDTADPAVRDACLRAY